MKNPFERILKKNDLEKKPLTDLVTRIIEEERVRSAGFGLDIEQKHLEKEGRILIEIVEEMGGQQKIRGLADNREPYSYEKTVTEIHSRLLQKLNEEARYYFNLIQRTKITPSNLAYNVHLQYVVSNFMRTITTG